jgi:hypothetical protein
MTDEIPRRGRHDLATDALDAAVRDATESFVRDVIDDAGHTVTYETLTIDAIRDALAALRKSGYTLGRGDSTAPIGFVGETADAALLDIARNYHPSGEDRRPEPSDSVIDVDSVLFHTDSSLPDDTILLIHPDAIAPTPPTDGLMHRSNFGQYHITVKPWLIRDSDGVAVIRQDGETDA